MIFETACIQELDEVHSEFEGYQAAKMFLEEITQ